MYLALPKNCELLLPQDHPTSVRACRGRRTAMPLSLSHSLPVAYIDRIAECAGWRVGQPVQVGQWPGSARLGARGIRGGAIGDPWSRVCRDSRQRVWRCPGAGGVASGSLVQDPGSGWGTGIQRVDVSCCGPGPSAGRGSCLPIVHLIPAGGLHAERPRISGRPVSPPAGTPARIKARGCGCDKAPPALHLVSGPRCGDGADSEPGAQRAAGKRCGIIFSRSQHDPSFIPFITLTTPPLPPLPLRHTVAAARSVERAWRAVSALRRSPARDRSGEAAVAGDGGGPRIGRRPKPARVA